MTIEQARKAILDHFPYCLCENDFTDGTAYCENCRKERIDLNKIEDWDAAYMIKMKKEEKK